MKKPINEYDKIIRENIEAVLGNYQGESPDKVIRTILERIIKIASDQLLLQKYIRQLGILSKLRNLQLETFKQPGRRCDRRYGYPV